MDKPCVVMDKTGKVLFMLDCTAMNKGDLIRKTDVTYIIIRKTFNMEIYAIEYTVEVFVDND